MDGNRTLSDLFEEPEFCYATNFSSAAASPDDIFSALGAWETASDYYNNRATAMENSCLGAPSKDGEEATNQGFEFQKPACSPLSSGFQDSETELNEAASPCCKRQKLINAAATASADQAEQGPPRVSHITVERNRRKQMNDHLSVLRSLMPCFHIKRGDQASIIGGAVDYIHELQQLLQSLEARKQRKAYAEVLSPSPRASPLSPRKPPLSPRLGLPLSPRTPQPSSPYKPWMQSGYLNSPSLQSPIPEPSPCNSSSSSINDAVNELTATSKSAVAEVEVKFSGPNLLLKTVSHRSPGQVARIVSALEDLALEILHLKISTLDDTMINSFTIKIGIECQLSAEELAHQILQTFC